MSWVRDVKTCIRENIDCWTNKEITFLRRLLKKTKSARNIKIEDYFKHLAGLGLVAFKFEVNFLCKVLKKVLYLGTIYLRNPYTI